MAKRETYAKAGVSINIAHKAKELIAKHASTTSRPEVLGEIGGFGGLWEFQGYQQPVLVSSVDGVGTKIKVASALAKHDTIGTDLVNHCVNDIITCGAEPLFFLDYIAMGKLVTEKVEAIAKGLTQACNEVGCALIGGETAEMPGLYKGEDYDLVGFIIGAVEKEKIITGETITAGDVLVGLPSSGLHTNGYSLVRKIFGESRAALDTHYHRLKGTLGQALLQPHRCYYQLLKPLLPLIKGLSHITGGGMLDNLPRILPDGLAVKINSQSWAVPPLFQVIQQQGNVDQKEMFHVFNMGIGMVLICSLDNADQLIEALPEAVIIGEVLPQKRDTRVTIR